MVTARRGKRVVRVSRAAYEDIFKPKGFVVITDDAETKKENTRPQEEQPKEEPKEEADDLETIPISDMTKQQLSEYAKRHGIDTSGARNVAEARRIIQKAERESKM